MTKAKNPHAVALGRRGGLVKSERKTLACRLNAAKRKKPAEGEPTGKRAK